MLKDAINKWTLKIIFIKLGFWVLKALTDHNKNSDNDNTDHSLYLLKIHHMLDTVPSTLYVLSLLILH